MLFLMVLNMSCVHTHSAQSIQKRTEHRSRKWTQIVINNTTPIMNLLWHPSHAQHTCEEQGKNGETKANAETDRAERNEARSCTQD